MSTTLWTGLHITTARDDDSVGKSNIDGSLVQSPVNQLWEYKDHCRVAYTLYVVAGVLGKASSTVSSKLPSKGLPTKQSGSTTRGRAPTRFGGHRLLVPFPLLQGTVEPSAKQGMHAVDAECKVLLQRLGINPEIKFCFIAPMSAVYQYLLIFNTRARLANNQGFAFVDGRWPRVCHIKNNAFELGAYPRLRPAGRS